MKINSKTGEWDDPRDRFLCSFGLIEGLALGIGSLAAGAGVGATTAGVIGTVGAGALTGAASGAALGAITGGDPGLGALTGGLTGGALGAFGGAGGLVDSATGLGATGSDALIGGTTGLVGAGITGSNPVTAGLTGAVGGAATAGLGDALTPSGAAASGATAPGVSAAAAAPPPGVGGISDLTGTAGSNLSGQSLDSLVSTAGGGPTAGAGGGGAGVGGLSGEFGGLYDAAGSSVTGTPGAAGNAAGAAGGGLGVGGLPGTVSAAGGGPAAGGAGAPQPNTLTTAWNNPTPGNIFRAVGANAAPLVAGAGLLTNLMTPNSTTGIDQLKSEAGTLLNQGQQLSSYLQSGRLPPGAQAALDQATKSAQASVRSRYASMGMSGSTAETQDINNVTLQAQTKAFEIADSLLKTGIDESGLATNIYESLANLDLQQSAATGSAIASLAAALSGSPTIRIG